MIGYEMFDEMTRSIEEDTVRTILHVKLEQKVEREQVAKVTGTNKDDTGVREPKKRAEKESISERSMPVRKWKEIQTVLRT